MIKTIFGSIVLIAIVLAAGAGIAFLKLQALSNPQAPPPEFPDQVIFSTAKTIQFRDTATAIGTVLAPRSMQLKTEVVGTVASIHFKFGEVVIPGQLLLKLDTSVEEAQMASYAAVEKIAESTFKRTKLAADARALTELELEQSAAMLSQAKADVARIEAIIRKKTLLAPFKARAGLFDIQPGQYLSEGTLITMLQGIDDFIYVDFMMSQQVADEIKVDHCVRLNIAPNPIEATVIAIDSQADKVTRSIMARAKVLNPPASMQMNDSVKVSMEYGPYVTAVSIPVTALRTAPTGAFVYVVKPDESDEKILRAKIQFVTPGRAQGNFVTILRGLEPDQSIVADGSFKIRDKSWIVNIETSTHPNTSPK